MAATLAQCQRPALGSCAASPIDIADRELSREPAASDHWTPPVARLEWCHPHGVCDLQKQLELRILKQDPARCVQWGHGKPAGPPAGTAAALRPPASLMLASGCSSAPVLPRDPAAPAAFSTWCTWSGGA